ncbi:MAG: hypothetical protein Q9184_003335 [Pyrenodesmia sp. 2 TL-2023]
MTSADELIRPLYLQILIRIPSTSQERTAYPSPPPTPPPRLTTSGRRSRWDWNTIPHDNEQSRKYIAEINAAMTQRKDERLGVRLQKRALLRKARHKIYLETIWLDLSTAERSHGLKVVLSLVRADERNRARVERLEELVEMNVETFIVTCLEEQAENEGLDLQGVREWVDEGWS